MRELYHLLDFKLDPLLNMTLPTKDRHTKISDTDINRELVGILGAAGIVPSNGAIFYSHPGFRTTICHVDCFIEDTSKEWPSLAKLNYIAGERNTLTMWYEVVPEKRRLGARASTSIAQPYELYKLRDCINIKTVSLSGWHLFEAGIPHTVSNPTKNPKWTISFILRDTITDRWLTYDEVKKRLLLNT